MHQSISKYKLYLYFFFLIFLSSIFNFQILDNYHDKFSLKNVNINGLSYNEKKNIQIDRAQFFQPVHQMPPCKRGSHQTKPHRLAPDQNRSDTPPFRVDTSGGGANLGAQVRGAHEVAARFDDASTSRAHQSNAHQAFPAVSSTFGVKRAAWAWGQLRRGYHAFGSAQTTSLALVH